MRRPPLDPDHLPTRPPADRPAALVGSLFALAGLVATMWWVHTRAGGVGPLTLTAGACYLFYLALAVAWTPEPDMNNLGWGGIWFLDRPFDLSDDHNRFLLLLRLVLWPGRLLGGGVRELWRCLAERGDEGA